ncbi:YggS family pyridoxal phosphate-dependent enzyme [Parachlamydia sp. AcF125]|uniref:YggS family pyridoxal phosphate-dependent enzyme n=1 Tax=Parachlamydia sp. AcF125 TaxID=2795736 RepID=UPI001BC8FE20|nr:YggS family pyridoxal phosphate-dependent enzyme [Parachlamydia sp. AcF125]MBS4168873.1 Pyridoxal phosphate homeostasis protein [Parachlamydia sp. AcF125]
MTWAQDNYLELKTRIEQLAYTYGRLPGEISLIAVTKTYPVEAILSVYEVGCHNFGENRVQEALKKQPLTPQDIQWHLIGSLQLNKVSKVIGKFALVHSVDSFEVARKISETSLKLGKKTSVLLQVNTSGELTKQGWTIESCRNGYEQLLSLSGICVEGLMTIAPFSQDEYIVRTCFKKLRKLKEQLVVSGGYPLSHLSMGMSNDFEWAIAEGATLLRIGTAIFGKRE